MMPRLHAQQALLLVVRRFGGLQIVHLVVARGVAAKLIPRGRLARNQPPAPDERTATGAPAALHTRRGILGSGGRRHLFGLDRDEPATAGAAEFGPMHPESQVPRGPSTTGAVPSRSHTTSASPRLPALKL